MIPEAEGCFSGDDAVLKATMYLSQNCGKGLCLAYAALGLSDPSLLHFWHREPIDLGCGKPTFSTVGPCVFFCASKGTSVRDFASLGVK